MTTGQTVLVHNVTSASTASAVPTLKTLLRALPAAKCMHALQEAAAKTVE